MSLSNLLINPPRLDILLIGGTSCAGKAFIEEALKKNIHIRAITRFSTSKAPRFGQGLVEWHKCDVYDFERLKLLADGCQAIVSLLSPKNTRIFTVYSETLKVILRVMKVNRIYRLITLTNERNNPELPWHFKFFHHGFLNNKWNDDMEKMEKALIEIPEEDRIEWTCVRRFITKRKDFTGRSKIEVGKSEQPFKPVTYTGDLANFLVTELIDRVFLRMFVTICAEKKIV